MIGGGAYLIVLGGSWYYAVAGVALLATAVLLFRRSRLAVWMYLALFAATVAWARAHGVTAMNATIRADNVVGLGYYAKRGFVDYATEPDLTLTVPPIALARWLAK